MFSEKIIRSMSTDRMSQVESSLRRARLSLRGGTQQIQKRMSVAELAALYDLVLMGMRDYIARHEGCDSFVEYAQVWDAAALYHALARAGVFDDPHAFNRFILMIERALWQGTSAFDAGSILADVETILKKLGIVSFDESTQ